MSHDFKSKDIHDSYLIRLYQEILYRSIEVNKMSRAFSPHVLNMSLEAIQKYGALKGGPSCRWWSILPLPSFFTMEGYDPGAMKTVLKQMVSTIILDTFKLIFQTQNSQTLTID